MVTSTRADLNPRIIARQWARISSDCSSGTLMKCQVPPLPVQSFNGTVTVITSPRQFPIRHPVRPRRLLAQAADLVFLIGFEIAFEPFDPAVALEGEDVGGEAVEEEAVVADDHRAAS